MFYLILIFLMEISYKVCPMQVYSGGIGSYALLAMLMAMLRVSGS